MKFLNTMILTGSLMAGCLTAQAYNDNNQPFSIEVYEMDDGDDDGERGRDNRGGFGNRGEGIYNSQICQAIQNQSRVQVLVKDKEVVNAKELKITLKVITVEPYAFGMTRDGTPVLKGNVVDQKDLKVVTVKVFEDRFNDKNPQAPVLNKKGWFSSDKGVRLVDLRHIKAVQVVPNSRFDAPKDFKGFDDKDLQVQTVCSVSNNAQGSGNDQYNNPSNQQQGMHNQYNR